MAATELELRDGGSVPAEPAWQEGGPLIRRPAEVVELAELVYRGIFRAGLVVASITTAYAVVLTALQPAGHRWIAVAVCSLLLLSEMSAVRDHERLYALLRRRPLLVLVPAAAIAIGCWLVGSHNQQLFYVLTILIGVLGVAGPWRVVAVSSVVAASGLALPRIVDGSWTVGVAVAAVVLPPLFWLVVEQLSRFMLRLHRATGPEPATPEPPRRVRAFTDSSVSVAPPFVEDVSPSEPREGRPERNGILRDNLTSRQLEVLLLVAEGLQNVEIASCLGISATQVGRHLVKARRRAGVATDAQLMAWARHSRLLPTDET